MPRLGLRTKFFLHSNALILVSMSLVTFLAVEHQRQSYYEAIEHRGRSVTEVLSIAITDALLYQELGLIVEEGLIDSYIGEVLERNKDLVRYVVVTDRDGRATHSNRWELLGKRYDRALGPEAIKSIGRRGDAEIRPYAPKEKVLEVRMPLNVSSRFWGSLAVGFSLAPIQQEIRSIARQAVLIALVLMLGNSLLTAAYVESLIRPVLALHRTMKRASQGDLTVRAEGGRGDEVRELADAFNRMMTELEGARKREKAQEAQLARAEKMAAVGTLAAGVAHEVNNPVAGVLTALDTLEADPDPETRRRYLALVRDGVKRIEHTVVNLLDFSRQRDVEARLTSFNDAVRHVLELVQYQVHKNRVEVHLELEPGGALVLADPFQMQQLLLNLLLNAIQAMPSGGSLTIRTKRTPAQVLAEVADTGTGIPAGIRDRIFDPFFTTRGVGQGTGLGLSVSYGIVTAHGGTIEVDSEAARGSTFRIALPAAPGTVAAQPAAREVAS